VRDDILSKAAILQRDGESYAITVPLLGGVMDLATARRIAEVSGNFGIRTIKITGAQRLALVGIKEGDLDAVHEALGVEPQLGSALCRQYIKMCPGNSFCTRGQRDTIAFSQKMSDRFYPFPRMTAKVKIGIAGCYNSCVEPAIKDIGLIGLPQGWILMAGGAGGLEPMFGEVLARNLTDDQVMEMVEAILKYYRGASTRPQTRNMRLGVILKKEGKERLLKICGLA